MKNKTRHAEKTLAGSYYALLLNLIDIHIS